MYENDRCHIGSESVCQGKYSLEALTICRFRG